MSVIRDIEYPLDRHSGRPSGRAGIGGLQMVRGVSEPGSPLRFGRDDDGEAGAGVNARFKSQTTGQPVRGDAE